MAETNTSGPVIGVATEKGPKRPLNADAHAHHQFHDRLAVAIVDGTGSTPEVAEFAQLAAATAVRIAARRTPVRGVMIAAELCEDPAVEHPAPSGTIVVATMLPNGESLVAWAGDAAAYGYDPEKQEVTRLTTPHTQGQMLREEGLSDEEARKYDNVITNSLARASYHGVESFVTHRPLLILASDGIHRLTDSELTDIVREHSGDPEMCAQQIVKAGREKSRDDITVLVVPHPHPKTERG
ncbi:PP2C family protein-serine/threonine phosphatase [Streptoalloteichus hindustanus]|uniref:Protein phosphatase n=1 Tax=Streptoalloteichus hindustanus TaxID=2017 RepID=A0A1M5F0Y6_STRHI|nr:PP2C family protein-serine/threonine phosphatase [Streptoalloteichus hindustanus]SHF85067.1 protein phosphatase [Streptoalloteichus hindustanus]